MSNNVRWAVYFGAKTGNLFARVLGPAIGFLSCLFLAATPPGLVLAVVLGLLWWWRGPQPTPQNLAILSRAWKWNLHLHAGYGSTAGGLVGLYFGFRQLDALHGFVAVLCLLAWFAGALVLLAYATWYWVRIYPRIGPLWDKVSTPVLSDRAIGQMADVAGFMAGTLESFDESASTPAAGSAGGGSAGNFHTGAGAKVTVASDGAVYVNGKFVGRRNAHGGITDGSGTFAGTIKDDGSLHAPNGDYVGRLFR